MEIGKKGALFTIIAIVMVSLLFVAATSYTSHKMEERSFVVSKRVQTVNYFINDLERDIKRGMYISTYRSLLAMQQHVTSTGEFVPNSDKAFRTLIVNGTYNGSYMSVMNDTELSKWFAKINTEADKISVDVDYEINNVSVYHVTPWKIKIELNVTLNVSDEHGTAHWVRKNPLRTNLSIVSFEDPIYNVETLGKVVNIVQPTNVTDFVDENDTKNLKDHINNRYYVHTNSSPSFLMRFSGDLNASEYGIESIVDLRKLEDVGISLKDKSCIDYIYFSDDNPASWKINNTYNWLRIDNQSNHLNFYEVQNLTG